jgi:hypothetical protein
MYHAIAPSHVQENYVASAHKNVFTRFYEWTVGQDEKRFMWLAFTFVLQVGLALPLTLLSIVTWGGNNFNLLLLACIANVPAFALSLAAQPTKVTLPVLFFAWLVDVSIILICAVSYFTHGIIL